MGRKGGGASAHLREARGEEEGCEGVTAKGAHRGREFKLIIPSFLSEAGD